MDPIMLAKELGAALTASEEYRAYQRAKKQIEEHEAAKIMLEDFRKQQWALEKKRLSGEEPGPEEVEKVKKLAEIVGYNPYIREYLMAEIKFTQLMMEVQKTIADSAGLEFPSFAGEKAAEEKKPEQT